MKRMRWVDLIAVNLFWLGVNIRNNAVSTVFMPYLVDRFVRPEIRNTALGGMRTAGLIIAMLVQPAVGLLSDRSTLRWRIGDSGSVRGSYGGSCVPTGRRFR